MSVDPTGIETRLSRVEQRVSDLNKRVDEVAASAAQVTVLIERVENLRREMIDRDTNTKVAINLVGTQVTKLDEEITEREEKRARASAEREDARAREHREARRAMYALTVTIICALIGATAVLITSFVH